jgi:putative ABC transport system ATP-binding protein
MAKRLGIESKLAKLCKTCSYGEQQRIAIIRALQQPFDFLLLDGLSVTLMRTIGKKQWN